MCIMRTDHNEYYPAWIFVTIIAAAIIVPIMVAWVFAVFPTSFMA